MFSTLLCKRRTAHRYFLPVRVPYLSAEVVSSLWSPVHTRICRCPLLFGESEEHLTGSSARLHLCCSLGTRGFAHKTSPVALSPWTSTGLANPYVPLSQARSPGLSPVGLDIQGTGPPPGRTPPGDTSGYSPQACF
jgi:hypothetical protein